MKILNTFILLISVIGSISGQEQWTGSTTINDLLERNGNIKANGLFFGKYGVPVLGYSDPFGIYSNSNSGEQDLLIFGNNSAKLNLRIWDGDFKIGPSANSIIYNNGSAFFNGSIGISSSNPTEKIDIGVDSKVNIKIGRWGALGITGSSIATVLGNNVKASTTSDNKMEIMTTTLDGAKAIKMQYNEGITFHTYQGNVSANQAFVDFERMRIDNNGNVGIGTVTPGSWKLAVNGKIRAKEIKVETGWSDFVFENDYKLPTLKEVENHIKEKGHLKDIPSAKEVEENGILLGEMDSKLLQKIEELTLYTIQQQKQIKELLMRLEKLESKK